MIWALEEQKRIGLASEKPPEPGVGCGKWMDICCLCVLSAILSLWGNIPLPLWSCDWDGAANHSFSPNPLATGVDIWSRCSQLWHLFAWSQWLVQGCDPSLLFEQSPLATRAKNIVSVCWCLKNKKQRLVGPSFSITWLQGRIESNWDPQEWRKREQWVQRLQFQCLSPLGLPLFLYLHFNSVVSLVSWSNRFFWNC